MVLGVIVLPATLLSSVCTEIKGDVGTKSLGRELNVMLIDG